MSGYHTDPEADAPLGVMGTSDNLIDDDDMDKILAELSNERRDFDLENLGDIDWENINHEDIPNLPGFSGPPGVNIASTDRAEARKESHKPADSQDIFSKFMDFDSPVQSSSGNKNPDLLKSLTIPAKESQTMQAEQPQNLSLVSALNPTYGSDYGNPPQEHAVSQQTDEVWQDSHRYAYRVPQPNISDLCSGPQFHPINQGNRRISHYNNRVPLQAAITEIPKRALGVRKTPTYSPEDASRSEYTDGEDTSTSDISPPYLDRSCLYRSKKSNPGKRSKTSWHMKNKSLQLTKRNTTYRPKAAYEPLRSAPKPWGPFRYTRDGELEPSDLFTQDQITRYLFTHPLHEQSQSKRESKLVLRIHCNPPDSANRFPTVHGSHRCRFRDCPSQNNTINQGQYAVIFDELSADHPDHDPFLNAAWVHMYCLERFCNFPKICKCLNVQIEKRRFERESNKSKGNNRMRLDKIRGIDTLVEKFIETCRQGTLPVGYPSFDSRDEEGQPYKGTLCYRMCLKKRKRQPPAVNRQEAARQRAAGRKSGSLSNHLGDLFVEAPIRHSTRKHENQNQLLANPKHHRSYKSGVFKDESEDEGEDEDESEDEENEEIQQRLRRYIAPTVNMIPRVPQYQHQHQALAEDFKFAMPTGNKGAPVSQYSTNAPPPLKVLPIQHTQPMQRTLPPAVSPFRLAPAPKGRMGAHAIGDMKPLGSPTALLEKRRASRKRGRDLLENGQEDDIVAAPKRHRTSEVTDQPATSNATHGANILPIAANSTQDMDMSWNNDSPLFVSPHESPAKKLGVLEPAYQYQPQIYAPCPPQDLPSQGIFPSQSVHPQYSHPSQPPNPSWQRRHLPLPGALANQQYDQIGLYQRSDVPSTKVAGW